jgi:hypothetical protein
MTDWPKVACNRLMMRSIEMYVMSMPTPRPTELLRRVYRRPAPAERVQDHRTRIGSELDDPFQQRQGLLGWVAEPFSS